MIRAQILDALNKNEGTLCGSVRTQDGKQLDCWTLNGKDFLIVSTNFWNYKVESPNYINHKVARVQLLTMIN
jgi:hypothetical protein